MLSMLGGKQISYNKNLNLTCYIDGADMGNGVILGYEKKE